MNKGLKILIAVVAVFTVALAGLVALRSFRQNKTGDNTPAAGGAVTVCVATVAPRTVDLAVTVTGEIESPAVVDVVSKVGGRLETLRNAAGQPLKEGDTVKAGEQVATIEHSQLDAMVAQAEAALRVAHAGLEQATVNQAHIQKERHRVESLLKDGSATEQQRDQAVAGHEAAVAAVKLTGAQVEQAEASTKLARLNRADADILSPISGVITMKYVDEGNLVGPSRPILRIVQDDSMKVAGNIAEIHLASLEPGRTVTEITVDACRGAVFTGVVSVVSPDVSRLTRTFKVEATVPNPGRQLKPGMFARMLLFTTRHENVPAIPDAAIVSEPAGRTAVYVVKDGVARKQAVTLGISDGTFHEVTGGLAAGDIVAIRGKESLTDGAKVLVP